MSAWAGRLRRALAKLELPNGLLSDGLTWKGKVVKESSVHAETLAIIAGLQPKNTQLRFDILLAPFLRGEIYPKTYPSSYWVTYVLEVAGTHGYQKEAWEFIRKKWSPMIS